MKREKIVYGLVLLVLFIIVGTFYLNFAIQKKQHINMVKFQDKGFLSITQKYADDVISHWTGHVTELSNSAVFHNYISALNNNITKQDNYKIPLEKEFLFVSGRHKETKAIRFIGSNGVDQVLLKHHKISKNYKNRSNDVYFSKVIGTKQTKLFFRKTPDGNFIDIAEPINIGSKHMGVLLITYNFNTISSLFEKFIIDGLIDNIFMVNQNGQLLYSTNTNKLLNSLGIDSTGLINIFQKEKKDNISYSINKSIFTFKKLSSFPVRIGIATYYSTITDHLANMLKSSAIIFIISIGMIILIGLLVIHMMSSSFRNAYEKINSSENYIKTILYTINNMLFILDAESLKIQQINQAVFLTLGYTEKDLVNKPISIILAQDDKSTKKAWDNIVKHKIVSNVELICYHKNGDRIPVLFSSSIVSSDMQDSHTLICVAQEITAQKKVEEELDYLARHDTLTNLANRLNFDIILRKEIARAQRHNKQFALFYIDLDDFKHINDKFGHDAGDLLLKETAIRLKSAFREEDMLFRMGGDKFAAIITELDQAEHAKLIAEKIIKLLNAPFTLMGNDINVCVSIGIAVYPRDGDDERVLVKNADSAMYLAKETGKNCYKFYPSTNQVTAKFKEIT